MATWFWTLAVEFSMTYNEEVVIDNIFCVTFLLCGLIPCAITGNGIYGLIGAHLYVILVCVSIYLFEQSKSEAEKKLIANTQCVSKILSLSSSLESLERSCERLQYDYDCNLNKDVIEYFESARDNLDKAWLDLNKAMVSAEKVMSEINNSLHTKQTSL